MNMEGEDSAHALFSSPVGWRGHLLASWSSPRGDAPDVVVSGERGELHLWGNRPFYDFYPAAPTPVSQLLSLVRPSWLAERLARPSHQRIRRRLDVARAWLEYTGYAAEVREFLLSIQDDREPATGGEDGRRDLEIALAATSSLATESWVAIPRSS
jgi:predicted dehydrogenase